MDTKSRDKFTLKVYDRAFLDIIISRYGKKCTSICVNFHMQQHTRPNSRWIYGWCTYIVYITVYVRVYHVYAPRIIKKIKFYFWIVMFRNAIYYESTHTCKTKGSDYYRTPKNKNEFAKQKVVLTYFWHKNTNADSICPCGSHSFLFRVYIYMGGKQKKGQQMTFRFMNFVDKSTQSRF